MPFPPKGGKPMFDDPEDEMAQGPHPEPDGDESYIDDLMSQDMSESDDELFKESPLESALIDAGYKVSPDQLSQIEAILTKPPEAPKAPGAEELPPAGKPPMPGAGPKPVSKMGGLVPGGLKASDMRA
jgi:hypothetical protein